MQKIVPFLLFDGNADEAANYYTSIFKNSTITNKMYFGDGEVLSVTFQVEGQEFTALNGGSNLNFTPAISFFIDYDDDKEIDELWQKFSRNGKVLMDLDNYPFSEKYGWIQDKYGISWQLNLTSSTRKISPFLMFVGDQKGRAEEAINFYTNLFEDSKIIEMKHYGPKEGEPEGAIKRARFLLNGQEFMALDSYMEHPFSFSHEISFFINCESQEEIDNFWEKLSQDGEKEGMGWLKDKYGLSWQVVPNVLGEMLQDKDPIKAGNAMKAMMEMDKLDIKKLKQAYNG